MNRSIGTVEIERNDFARRLARSAYLSQATGYDNEPPLRSQSHTLGSRRNHVEPKHPLSGDSNIARYERTQAYGEQ